MEEYEGKMKKVLGYAGVFSHTFRNFEIVLFKILEKYGKIPQHTPALFFFTPLLLLFTPVSVL